MSWEGGVPGNGWKLGGGSRTPGQPRFLRPRLGWCRRTAGFAHLTGPAAVTSVTRDESTVTSTGELGVRGEPWCKHSYAGPPSPAPTRCLMEAPTGRLVTMIADVCGCRHGSGISPRGSRERALVLEANHTGWAERRSHVRLCPAPARIPSRPSRVLTAALRRGVSRLRFTDREKAGRRARSRPGPGSRSPRKWQSWNWRRGPSGLRTRRL